MLLHVLFVGISFLAIQTDSATWPLEPVAIACENNSTCASVLNPSQKFSCLNGFCMCQNEIAKRWENCQMKYVVVGAVSRTPSRRCDVDDDCHWIEGSKCYLQANNSTKRCDCPEHMVMSYNSSEDGHLPRCLKIAQEPGAECTESIQCVKGLGDSSECDEGRCKCIDKFHFAARTSKRCIPDKVFGETCTKDEESCYQLAGPHKLNALNCSSRGHCRCMKNYTPINGSCVYSDATRYVINTSLVMMLFVFVTRMI